MPTTINGIGTQYYGRKNPRAYEGYCEACGRLSKLTDYETGYYFVVLYIPLIPLGKKQIIGDCGYCRRHQSMPLRQWEQLREESLQSGLDELAGNMDDPTKAIELLQRMTVFNQMDEAMDLAAATAKQHSGDFATQLDLGSWYERHGHSELADRCFARATKLDPDHPNSKRIQAVDAIRSGRLKEADTHLNALRDNPEYYDPAVFFTLASGYQQAEMHDEALKVFEDLLQRNPALAGDKAFRKAVRKSEKAKGTGTSMLPKKKLFA